MFAQTVVLVFVMCPISYPEQLISIGTILSSSASTSPCGKINLNECDMSQLIVTSFI